MSSAPSSPGGSTSAPSETLSIPTDTTRSLPAPATTRSPSSATSCLTLSTQATVPSQPVSAAPRAPSPPPKPGSLSSDASLGLSNQARYQRHILSLTNRLRARAGARPVRLHAGLSDVARRHNRDVARMGELSHVSSDGRTLTERLLEQGYDFRYASENLARGQRDCNWVMNSWMKSPGHRRNVLNDRVVEMGLSVRVWNGRMYWCQVFGVRRR